MSNTTNPTDHKPLDLAQTKHTPTPRPLYAVLASLMQARQNCQERENHKWFDKHTDRIEELVSEHRPSGGGFDSGTTLDIDRSSSETLIFTTSFHHMSESGMYDGWTNHQVIVTPSLAFGFSLRITNRDQNGIKEYIRDTFRMDLETPVV